MFEMPKIYKWVILSENINIKQKCDNINFDIIKYKYENTKKK
jgi:hypothetical protein